MGALYLRNSGALVRLASVTGSAGAGGGGTFTPSITGTPDSGSTLTANIVGTAPSPTYQWMRDGSPIFGATTVTYLLSSLDIAKTITVAVTASGSTVTSAGVLISGTPGAFPAISMIARFRSDQGVTAVDGRVSQWDDISGNARHATQATVDNRPYLTTDLEGRQHLAFTASFSEALSHFLGFGDGYSFDARNMSVFMVMKVYQGFQTPFGLKDYDSFNAGHIRFHASPSSSSAAFTFLAGGSTSGIKLRNNLTMWGVSSAAGGCVAYTNDGNAISTSAAKTGTYAGAWIGKASSGNWMTGDIYEIVVVPGVLSTSDRNALFAYFADHYGLPTTALDKNLVAVGDSITAGAFDTLAQMRGWPTRVSRAGLLNWQIANMAVSGDSISNIDARKVATNAYKNASATRNILTISCGRNDMGGGQSAATFYANLVTLVQTFVAAGWEVWVSTVIATGTVDPQPYPEANARIRGTSGYAGIIADAGATHVIDFAALPEFDEKTDSFNATYYIGDSTHLTVAGENKMAAKAAADLLAY